MVIMVLAVAVAMAQAPEKFTYQAVVRNASNALVANTLVGVRVSILQGGASGSAVYVETQTGTTNANGLVTLSIGGGSVQQGTFANMFAFCGSMCSSASRMEGMLTSGKYLAALTSSILVLLSIVVLL